MRIIELDGSGWKTPLDFLRSLYEGIAQGHPHGMSPDAFVDSMIWRGMGGVEPPYVVKVVNLKAARPEVAEYVAMMASLLAEARQERLDSQGIDIEVSISVSLNPNQGAAPSQIHPKSGAHGASKGNPKRRG